MEEQDRTHSFGTMCREHGHVMLSQACPCGTPHGYADADCSRLCPEHRANTHQGH